MRTLILILLACIASPFLAAQQAIAADLPKCPGSPPIFMPLSKQPYCSKAGWNNCVGKLTLPGWNGWRYEGIWKNGRLSSGSITYNRSDKYKRTVTGPWRNECSLIEGENYVVNYARPGARNGRKTYKGQLNKKGKYHGKGQLTFANGTIQEGYFKNGNYVGKKNVFEKSTLQTAFELKSVTERKLMQKTLRKLGFYKSAIDGLFGPGTQKALETYNSKYFNNSDLNSSPKAFALVTALLQTSTTKVELKPEPKIITAPKVEQKPVPKIKSAPELTPKFVPLVKTVPKVELKPVPALDTTPKAKRVESTRRDFTKEFNLSFYGSFLHSEKIPSALFFFGDIEKLDSFEFRKALRNHKINLIVLSSPGGLVWEGLSIAGIVHDKGLNTYVPKNSLNGQGICASACSFMFFAGKNRAANGKLGVHQFYSGDSEKKAEVGDTQKAAQFTVSEIIGFLNEFETPPWVFERMFQQSEMYYFKESELLQLETETTELQRAAYGRVEAFISELRTAFEETKN